MKKIIFILLISIFLLFGCVQPVDTNTSVGRDQENNDTNVVLLESQLVTCLRSKAVCEQDLVNKVDINCPECDECPQCLIANDCNAVAEVLGTQISTCSAQKSVLSGELDECVDEKKNFSKELETKTQLLEDELSKKMDLTVQHYVPGNLGGSGTYRIIQADIANGTKIVAVGLEYSGGSDNFFMEGLLSGLVRWYELTKNDSNGFDPVIIKSVYESEAGDTVLLEQASPGSDVYYLKIKSDEFNAGTSKEGLAIRRIMVVYTNYSN